MLNKLSKSIPLEMYTDSNENILANVRARNLPSQGFQELFSYAAADGVIVCCARKRGHKAKQKHESLRAG